MGYQLSEAELDRLATAFHEAGHAVAAVALGGRVHQVLVDDHPRTEFTTLPAGTASAVTFAGPWSEARWTHGRVPGPADIRAALTRNGSDDQALCAAGGPHQGAFVVPLLERCWPAIKTVTRQLYRTGTAAHADVCASLGLSDDGGPGSVALAMIRSGSHPGTFAVVTAAG